MGLYRDYIGVVQGFSGLGRLSRIVLVNYVEGQDV